MNTRMDAVNALTTLNGFIGRAQLSAIGSACRGEEKRFFYDKLVSLASLVASMPKTYEQDGKGMEAIVSLHYFNAGSDWFILEKDIEGGVDQAFGYAILNGDTQNAELGYISIRELVDNGVELDLYFAPRTLSKIIEKRAA